MALREESYSEDQYLVTHLVDRGQTGIRLDRFLKDRYRKRSREQIQRAIEDGSITIERLQGRHVSVGRLKPSSQLLEGDRILVLSERKPEPEVCFDYKILYEDEGLFVIDKPSNLPVHPAGRYFFNTLLVHLKTHGFQDPLKAEREYFLVHRIDKETSGILVLAKTREVCADLTKQFADRQTEKRYLAIARGITPEQFKVDACMRRHTKSVIELKMMTVPEDHEGAMTALTQFKRLEVQTNPRGTYSLVECLPKTGRQHQIRVHLDHAGHAIIGDKLYGFPEEEALRFFERRHLTPEAQARLVLHRHALHAAGIRFRHPLTGLMTQFESPLPQDLRAFLDTGQSQWG